MSDIVEEVLALGRVAELRIHSRRPSGSGAAALPKRPNKPMSRTLRKLATRRSRRLGGVPCRLHG